MHVLLLGGTSEATALAGSLAVEPGVDAVLSLAGVTTHPRPSPLPTRIGGFGGADGLCRFLRAYGIDAVVDATHPFAAAISRNAVLAADAASVPILRIDRPPWEPGPEDRWTAAADMFDAARAIGSEPRRVFLAIGRRDLPPFRDQAPQHAYTIRSIEPPAAGSVPPRSRILLERGPFDEEHERRLLTEAGIEVVVAKNSGGEAVASKLVAARILHLPVVMVRRPPFPDPNCESVPDWPPALDWLRRLRTPHQAVSTRRGV